MRLTEILVLDDQEQKYGYKTLITGEHVFVKQILSSALFREFASLIDILGEGHKIDGGVAVRRDILVWIQIDITLN